MILLRFLRRRSRNWVCNNRSRAREPRQQVRSCGASSPRGPAKKRLTDEWKTVAVNDRLDDRFHETYRFELPGAHPEEQVFALRAKACVSKDGGLQRPRLRPSFETHRLRDAPLDEVREGADMIRIKGNAPLVRCSGRAGRGQPVLLGALCCHLAIGLSLLK